MNANRLSLAVLVTAVLAFLPAFPAAAGDVDDVNAAEEARYNVMIAQDRAALAAILADEFVYNQPSGRVQDKAGYIEQVTGAGSEVRIKKAERYDIKVNLHGTTATVMGSTKVDVELKGEPKQFDLRFLNVWVKRDGRWQIVARQSAYKTPAK